MNTNDLTGRLVLAPDTQSGHNSWVVVPVSPPPNYMSQYLSDATSLSVSPNLKLQRATETLDEITRAISHLRGTTPESEPAFHVHVRPTCQCCERKGTEKGDGEECETVKSWMDDRAKLVDRLVLSAGVYCSVAMLDNRRSTSPSFVLQYIGTLWMHADG